VDLAGILAQLAGATAHLPPGLMLLAAATLACVLVWILTRGAGIAAATTLPSARAVALRAKSRRTAYLRQRDPSAAGRPRPRAPSGCPAAA
jgi:Family of unknown function (DUF6412)